MENENKNSHIQNQSNNNRSKNRPHKHKAYFIEPAAGEQKNASKSEQAKQDNTANSNNQRSKSNNQHNNHHKGTNHKKNNASNVPKVQKARESAQDSARAEQTIKPSAEPQSFTKQNNRNKNRPHGDKRREEKSRQQRNEQNPESASKEPISGTKDILQAVDSFITPPKSVDKLQRPATQKMTKFSESPEYAQYSDYEEFSFEELYGNDDFSSPSQNFQNSVSNDEATASSEPMVEVVGIRFKASGKTYYFAPNGIALRRGGHAIVETARGLEYGEVAVGNTMVKESETIPPLRPIVRKATEADIKHHAENKEKEDAAFRVCNEKIIAHELDMKLIDAQYTFDNSKLLFYFTSSGRVDFRELVKDLASVFRTRIELRQIGIRDEAKMVGGLGLCGRPLCCSLFLTDFGQVSIKMAKEQNLSLNSSKISGICGRLMCCLRYEHDTYEYEIKRTPPVDSLVRTVDGIGVVTEINPLAATIKVKLNSSPDTPSKSYKRDEVSVLKKKQENS